MSLSEHGLVAQSTSSGTGDGSGNRNSSSSSNSNGYGNNNISGNLHSSSHDTKHRNSKGWTPSAHMGMPQAHRPKGSSCRNLGTEPRSCGSLRPIRMILTTSRMSVYFTDTGISLSLSFPLPRALRLPPPPRGYYTILSYPILTYPTLHFATLYYTILYYTIPQRRGAPRSAHLRAASWSLSTFSSPAAVILGFETLTLKRGALNS